MRAKKVFSIITIVSVILTIFGVGFLFMRNLHTGKQVYNNVCSFHTSPDSNNLKDGLTNCAIQTEEVLATTLNSAQKEYLYDLSTTLDKLAASESYLMSKLLFDNRKALATNQIANNYNDLSAKRSDLIHKILIYRIKMSGNIYGDPVGTFNIMVEDVLSYLDDYTNTLQQLNNYVYNTLNLNNETAFNLISIHFDIVHNVCNNYKDLTFLNATLETLNNFNSRFRFLDNGNLVVNSTLIGGLYSNEAYQFNRYYSNCDKAKFAIKFVDMKNLSINPVTEKDYTHLAFYYLNLLVKEGV